MTWMNFLFGFIALVGWILCALYRWWGWGQYKRAEITNKAWKEISRLEIDLKNKNARLTTEFAGLQIENKELKKKLIGTMRGRKPKAKPETKKKS